MNPLIVKGVVFGLLLACAALWDMKEREIPDLIPAMILVCGLIELRPAASVAGLLVTGGPYPVSYTHLDVYKRQPFCTAGADGQGHGKVR